MKINSTDLIIVNGITIPREAFTALVEMAADACEHYGDCADCPIMKATPANSNYCLMSYYREFLK